MSRAVITTVGLVGLFMSAAIDLVIVFGRDHYGNVAIGSTMGLVAFSLMLVIAAFESRDEKESILRMETFDNNVVNLTILIEVVLAILIARGGLLTSLLNTQALTSRQWLIGGALPALVLFILWEIGKLIARRAAGGAQAATPAEAMPRAAVELIETAWPLHRGAAGNHSFRSVAAGVSLW